jgi:ribosomal protection tetracycline resistance protein
VNKIDRAGAYPDRVLAEIRDRLQVAVIPLTCVRAVGTRRATVAAVAAEDGEVWLRLAEVLADRDEDLLAAYVEGRDRLSEGRLRAALAAQTARGLIHPVFLGSAITGAGVAELTAGITELLPTGGGDPAGPVAGAIFKIERSGSGEKVAYARMVSGTIRVRDKLTFGADRDAKVTAIAVFDRGPAAQQPSISAGQIGKLWGLSEVQIGDRFGQQKPGETARQFPPPTLESVVIARQPADRGRLRVALGQLAEQDPLINVRQDDERQEISVSLYGEVQKEIIQATLADEYGIDVTFSPTTTIYIERPAGTGSAIAVLQSDDHPYSATIGLSIAPGPADSGVCFRLDLDPRTIPLYIYKTAASFTESMKQYVLASLHRGRYGWRITDIVVTMTRCGYYVGDGPAKQVLATPRTTAADFRKLTPRVLALALERAGTIVCQPITRGQLEIPADRLGAVLAALARLGAAVDIPQPRGDLAMLEAELPSGSFQILRRQLPGLTGGEGVLEASFGGYQPVHGSLPTR